MKENFKAIFLIIIIIGVVIFTSYNAIRIKLLKASGNHVVLKKVNPIITGRPAYKIFTKQVKWFGEVKPVRVINLISPIQGNIEKIYVKNGENVKKGDKILKLGGKVINDKINLLQTKIRITKEKLEIAKKLYEFKKLSFSKKLIKKDELLNAEKNYINLQSDFNLLNKELKIILSKTILTSPINGTFLSTNNYAEGQLLNKGDSIGKIISTEKLMIIGHIFLNNPEILINKEVKIDDNSFKITKILPYTDSNGATIFWIQDQNLSKYFKIGEKVSGTIILKIKKALCVPENSIIVDEYNNSWVFVKKGNDFAKVKVITGLSQNGWTEIISGIKTNDIIVTNGAYELFYKDFSKTFKVED